MWGPKGGPRTLLRRRPNFFLNYLIFEVIFQNFDFFGVFFNKMGVKTIKIELSMQIYADLAIEIEICL